MPAGAGVNGGPDGFAAAGHSDSAIPLTARVAQGWRAWRHWRHTRPFWGGLLIVLGGAEILLSEKAPLPLIIHIGLQGLAGYLIPAVMVLCGLLLLFHPVQRTFYSILAILLALGSWITSNLGGFFVGMLLGLIGGSLAFAWQQRDQPRPGKRRRRPRLRPGPIAEHAGTEQAQPEGERQSGSAQAWPGAGPLCIAAIPLAQATSLVLSTLVAPPGLVSVAQSPAPVTSAAAAQSDLTAASATFGGLSFRGIASVPTAAGKVMMLKLSMDSLTLSDTTLSLVRQDGHISVTSGYSLGFAGQVVLYTTKISGKLHGVRVGFAPERVPPPLPADLTLTNLVADQPYIIASSLQTSGLQITDSSAG